MFKVTPMTGNVLKNLFTKKSTRLYPFEVREPFENNRGELYIDIDNCIFCSTCARKCPSQCITVDKEKGIWRCDAFACVYCGTCGDHCPTKCLHHKRTWRPVSTSKVIIEEHGTPPKPKKKAAATKEEATE